MPSESESNNFIGSMVSIDCGPLGSYQGHVQKIDPVMNTLTISHAFHNGLSCDQPQVSLSSTTILDIQIIHSSSEAKEIIERKATPSKMTKEIDEVTKPTCSSPVKIIKAATKARTGFSTASTSGPGVSAVAAATGKGGCRRKLSPPDSPSKFMEAGAVGGHRPRMSKSAIRESTEQSGNGGTDNGASSKRPGNEGTTSVDHHGKKATAARKMDRGGKKGSNPRNNECFSAPVDSFLQEFDFESNLALFNKKAVFQEIENGFPDLTLESDPAKEGKYRHDENVLQPGESNSSIQVRQQIETPEPSSQLFYTDNGLVVPSISLALRNKVCETASCLGLTQARQRETFGRAASEMVIQLIGGSHRIHPKNDHQMPVVAALCGPHEDGAVGVCCARILASHGVRVIVMTPNVSSVPDSLTQELELFKLTGNTVIHNVKRLPDTIDLIVSALDSAYHPALIPLPWQQAMIAWATGGDIRAQVLALDPPETGPSIPARWSLFKVLPVSQNSAKCGSLYLCDLSIPDGVFSQHGVKYTSPFGPKFVIPLHQKA